MKKVIATLARGDLKNILRDSTLVMAVFGPIAILLLLYLFPLLEVLILERFDFDLSQYRLFALGFLSLIPSMLFGMIFGFLMLDERDEDIISFISITPLKKTGYLTYKLQMPMLFSAGFFLLLLHGTGLVELHLIHTPFIAVMVALEAAIGALFLVSYADNKVEGLAFSKLLGIMYLAVPVVFLWHSPWHWITAWMPSFWIAKAFIHSNENSSLVWMDIGLGLVLHFAVLTFFLRAFLKRPK